MPTPGADAAAPTATGDGGWASLSAKESTDMLWSSHLLRHRDKDGFAHWAAGRRWKDMGAWFAEDGLDVVMRILLDNYICGFQARDFVNPDRLQTAAASSSLYSIPWPLVLTPH